MCIRLLKKKDSSHSFCCFTQISTYCIPLLTAWIIFTFIFSYTLLTYFYVNFDISMYNMHKGLSVTQGPEHLVLQSINYDATSLPRKMELQVLAIKSWPS